MRRLHAVQRWQLDQVVGGETSGRPAVPEPGTPIGARAGKAPLLRHVSLLAAARLAAGTVRSALGRVSRPGDEMGQPG